MAMAPPLACASGSPQWQLLQAAADGDLRLFKRIARRLDGGKGVKGRLKEAVEAVKNRGAGALHQAAGNGNAAVCAYLVEELQVDIDATDESGCTPLNYAVRGGYVRTVSYLLDHVANPEKPGEQGCTPLHIAVREGNHEIVKVLLAKGADVDSFSDSGTPLHLAALKNQYGSMKILLEHHADAGADVKGVGTFTPLIAVAMEGLTDFYKCLLDAGADPNVPDEFGRLPIEIAALQNRWKDVEILLPVTSRIPSVHDWSFDGIINHVKHQVEVDPLYEMKPDDLKSEGNRAYRRKDLLP